MKEQKNRLTIHLTKKPHTFFLKYNYRYYSNPSISFADDLVNYKRQAQQLINEVNELGLKANLKARFRWNNTYYITFRSKYSAAAFKLGWM